jgi:hypothetical protein
MICFTGMMVLKFDIQDNGSININRSPSNGYFRFEKNIIYSYHYFGYLQSNHVVAGSRNYL